MCREDKRRHASPLPRSFYARPTVEVARALLGKVLVRPGPTTRVARIVEVEAYLGERDAASHARRGPTPRARIMFGPPGHLYVYLIYGMHHCMNVVTEADGIAGAVLIRGAAPLEGWGETVSPRLLAGPGKLCAGMGVTRAQNGLDLTADEFFVADDGTPPPLIERSARIGVGYAGSWARRKLRFFVPGSPHVSGFRVTLDARRRAPGTAPYAPASARSRLSDVPASPHLAVNRREHPGNRGRHESIGRLAHDKAR